MPVFVVGPHLGTDLKHNWFDNNNCQAPMNATEKNPTESSYSLDQRKPYMKNSQNQKPASIIDATYDQWNKFENFMKFAQKKEVKDRLKEFDAPDVANYIDPDTIDRILKTHKEPIFKKNSRKE